MNRVLISIFLTMFLTACGEGFHVAKLESDVLQSEIELTEVEKASIQMMTNLESEIVSLESIDFSELENVDLKLSQLNRIKSGLSVKLSGIADRIHEFRQRLVDLRAQINNYIATLDPNDPNQRQIIDRLQKLLDRVAHLEQALDRVIDLLNSQLNIIDQIFNRLLDRLDSKKPTHLILRFVIESIRDVIKAKIGF